MKALKIFLTLCLSALVLASCNDTTADNDTESETEKATESVSETETASETATETETPKETEPATDADDEWKKDYDSAVWLSSDNWADGFRITCNSKPNQTYICGTWQPVKTDVKKPDWRIGQWGTWKSYTDHSKMNCLWEDRLESDPNTLTNGINTVTYNPDEESLTMRIDTYDFYNGKGHTNESSWPHLLIEHDVVSKKQATSNPALYSLGADKVIFEMDIRLTEFEHKPSSDGVNALQLLSYYYMVSPKSNTFTWWSIPMFDDRGYSERESGTFLPLGDGTYVYGYSEKRLFDNTDPNGRRSFYNDQKKLEASDEWLHVEIDMTKKLQQMERLALKQYKNTESLEDFYFGGMNFGFEIHGSYKCTIEVKNYKMTAYSLKDGAETEAGK